MNTVKQLILTMPSDELRANVQVCLEHSCTIFLGNYQGLDFKEEAYVKEALTLEKGEPSKDDLEFKEILEVFQRKMAATQSLWHSMKNPVKTINKHLTPLQYVILGIIQAFELSEVPSTIPLLLEALTTGQWKNFVLISAELISPSGIKMEVLGEIIIYLIQGEDLLDWCKREITSDSCESFNLYANQAVKPFEKLFGETPETGGKT